MASEAEIEAAAERTVRWQVACGDGTHEQHEYGSDLDLQRADESELVDWAVARLAADRAEREERARPIDAEWCISQGAKRWEAGRECLFDCGVCFADHVGDAGILRGGVYFKATTFHGVPQNCHVPQIKTRGQLLDLLRVLKGGAE